MKRVSLDDLSGQTFDLLIIGGGATGACAARDAALRGLSTVLLEKEDFASGTSSRSTKLLHGGIRYLEKFEFGLVKEACQERELMMTLAPHLSHSRPFIYLIYKGDKMVWPWMPATLWMLHIGQTMYDTYARIPKDRRHHMLGKQKLLEVEPHLNPNGLKGGGLYYDSLTDDARFVMDTIKGACEAGALASNHTEVTGFVYEDDKIRGVEAVDHITGAEGVIRARQVINATGPWTDLVRFMEEGVTDKRLSPTRGIHIVLHKRDFPLDTTVFISHPRDGRTTWPIPSLNSDLVYIGTTDTFHEGSYDHVVATEEDVDYLLELANYTLPDAKVGYEHIIGTWAGLRPLVKPANATSESAISREHEIFLSPNGLLNIAGGKITTSRVMGKDVVDRAVELLAENYGVTGVPVSNTTEVPLSGGNPGMIARSAELADAVDLPPDVRDRLLAQYGGNFAVIADKLAADPSLSQGMGGHDLVAAEVHYAVEDDMAMTVTDFFARRATLFYWLADGGLDVANAVATEMGSLLGWDSGEQQKQIAEYGDWVAANRFKPVDA